MIVRLQSGGILNPPVDSKGVDSIVVCTDEGTPVMAAVNLEGRIWMHTVNEPQFAELMGTLGFDKRSLPEVSVIKP